MTPKGGAWLEIDKLRRAVKDAGFKPGDVRCTLSGVLVESQDRPAIRLEGSDRTVALQPEPGKPKPFERAQQAIREAPGTTAEIEGLLTTPAAAPGKAPPLTLNVFRLEIRRPAAR